MSNLCHKMIHENISDFEDNDQILFITLEDDIQHLSKRLCSIFGNYKAEVVSSLYKKSYDALKANRLCNSDNNLPSKIEQMFDNLLKSTIANTTNGKVNFTCMYFPENTFSPGDLSKLIDQHKMEGFNTKLVFLDYVDTMTPTVNVSNMSDYDKHGIIIQELRNLSRNHKVPVITATQNARSSENLQSALNNSAIGDKFYNVTFS